jgi:hypothetical protein
MGTLETITTHYVDGEYVESHGREGHRYHQTHRSESHRPRHARSYGLHAAVIGTDLERARRIASHLRAGRVVINGMTDDPQAPWGGFKYSGVGREYGRYGIEAFLETRAILES